MKKYVVWMKAIEHKDVKYLVEASSPDEAQRMVEDDDPSINMLKEHQTEYEEYFDYVEEH